MTRRYTPAILVFFMCGLGLWNDYSAEVLLIPMAPQWATLSDRTEPEIALCYGQSIPTHRWDQRSLTLVPGISDRLAMRILKVAQSGPGGFHPCQLESVPGIGPKLAGRIRSMLLGGVDCPIHL